MRQSRAITAGYGIASLLVGVALGIFPGLVTGDLKPDAAWVQFWFAFGLGAVGFAALGFSFVAMRGADRVRMENGTAYIIAEEARFWDDDKAGPFRAGISRRFARVVLVPGPVEASRGWDWPLDGDARHWDARVDELVRAFRVLNIDETRSGAVTPNGVFLWAYWAIAVAFGMRATAADRGLVLDVWQRPSRARAGEVGPEIWGMRPHRFGAAVPASGLEFTEFTWPARLTVSRRGRTRAPACGDGVTVLLIRFSGQAWGPVPPVTSAGPTGDLALRLADTAGVIPTSTESARVHELRCVPPGGLFLWEQFPALVAEAAAWIERKARELSGHRLILGTVIPPEVGLGLGILAGQESRRATWPAHLWPAVYESASGQLVIPHLDLGAGAVDPARASGREP